jgi:hypothetical protein
MVRRKPRYIDVVIMLFKANALWSGFTALIVAGREDVKQRVALAAQCESC